MKKLHRSLRYLAGWISIACPAFTACILIYTLIAGLMGETAVRIETIFSILLITAIGMLIQYLCFTDHLIHHMRYSRRLLLFGVMFLPLLMLCASIFNWLPKYNVGAWALFLIIFIVSFALITLSFEIYYRLMGKKYEGLLGEYKKSRQT